jgi:hypothetical protein
MIPHLLGIVTGGEVDTAARDQGRLTVPPDAFVTWVTEQGRLFEEAALSAEQKAVGAEIILKCGGTIGNLPVAFSGNMWLTLEELRPLIASQQEIAVHVGEITHEADDAVGMNVFDNEFKPLQDLIIIPKLSKDFMHPVRFGRDGLRTSLLLSAFEDLLQNVWGGFEEFEDYGYPVGSVGGEDIIRPVNIYSRGDSKS